MNNNLIKKKILIVDDEKINIDILRDLLSDYDKVAALNGEQALQVVSAATPPDLILLDVMMPDMDGYEICQRLKANDKTKDIPVIFVTAKAEIDDEIKGFASGAVDYIIKPISPPVVMARVATQLALSSAYQSLEQQHAALAEKERYIRSLIDHSLEMIVSLDEQFKVVEFNHSAEKVFGYTLEEMQKQPLRRLFAHDIKFDLVEGLLVSKGKFTGEMEMVRKSGETFAVYLKFNRLQDVKGQVIGAIGSMRDMTTEKLLAKFNLKRQGQRKT